MRFGIRSKMVLLLTIVALLPLLAVLIANVIELTHFRGRVIGENVLELAESQALVRQVWLTSDIQKLLLLTAEPSIPAVIGNPRKLPQEELDNLDRQWPKMPLSDPRMSAVLYNQVADVLRQVQKSDPQIRMIEIADHYGQLVASTGRTDDFYQGDEEWWQKSYAYGKGMIFIPQVAYNTEASNTWTIDLCVPIAHKGQIIGIIREEIDVSPWVETMASANGVPIERLSAQLGLMLVGGDGTIIYRRGVQPLTEKMADWRAVIAAQAPGGWRFVNDELQAYTPLCLPEFVGGFKVIMPDWMVVMYTPRSSIRASVYTLSAVKAVVGLVVIAVVFLLGALMIDRSLTRRILRLEDVTQKVAKGDLSQRIRTDKPGGGFLGRDEIDDLAAGFNGMIEHVQRSTTELQSANELKSNFIRVAGHELRTPVSYILGMARLLKDSADPTRLLFAVQSMGAKARRLNEIIQAMFKLMPDGFTGEGMKYSRIILSELLEEVYIDLFPFVESRGQRLIIEVVDQLPPLTADLDKLRDIIENMVMNAIKFTPDAGVVKVRCSKQLGDRVMISVQDQGPGIPESEYPRLFQPFYSGSDVLTHSSGESGYQKRGIGLGLAIVRHFVELHHGSVQVSSSPNGTTFSVTIPIEPVPPEMGWPRPDKQET